MTGTRNKSIAGHLLATTSVVAVALGLAQAAQAQVTTVTPPITLTGTHGAIYVNTGPGDVTNAGIITATAMNFPSSIGITVPGNVSVGGSIVNTGAITASLDGIYIRQFSTLGGGVTNSGAITAQTGIAISNATLGGGITNSGTISVGGAGILLLTGSSLGGGITNTGAITVSGNATGIKVFASTLGGGVTNSGAITASNTGIYVGLGSTIGGGITNSVTITASGNAGIGVGGATIGGGITNTGAITVADEGINVFGGGALGGGIANSGAITAGNNGIIVNGSSLGSGITNSGAITASNNGIYVGQGSTFGGGITNSGAITVIDNGIYIRLTSTLGGGITNSGAISSSVNAGIRVEGATIRGAITNSGAITGRGNGIYIGQGSTLGGGITNSGKITANAQFGTGIRITGGSSLGGAIVNTGTVSGGFAAIDVSGAGKAVTIDQQGGLILGNVNLSAGNADVVTVSGGVLSGVVQSGTTNGSIFTPSATVASTLNLSGTGMVLLGAAAQSNVHAFNQTGGTLAVTVTSNAALHGSLKADTVTIATGSVFQAVEQGNGFAVTQIVPNVLISKTPIPNNFTVTSASPDFIASLAPDVALPNDLDLTLRINPSFLTPSRLTTLLSSLPGLDRVAPALVTQGAIDQIQDRLGLAGTGGFGSGVGSASVGSHGLQLAALDESTDAQLAQAGASGGTGTGLAFWSQGYGSFATGADTAAAPGFSATTGGVLAGADYAVNDGLLVGAALDYSDTTLTFNAASGSAHINNFMILPYGRYTEGDWYVSGVGALGFADINMTTQRALPPFTVTASGNPGGQVYGVYGETGYRVHTSFAGAPATLTPLAGLGYTNFNTDGFTETGAGGADATVGGNSTDSFVSSLGVRASARFEIGGLYGTLVPEVHAIWRHEFLSDQATITASFAGTPSFTVAGSHEGTDTARLGGSLTQELNPAAKLFLNYDAELQSGLTQHTVSAGLRVKF